jgi:hypothetical protein
MACVNAEHELQAGLAERHLPKALYDYCTFRSNRAELACFQRIRMVELVGIELCRSVESM